MEEIEVEAGVWFKRGCSIIWDNRCLTRLVKDNTEITPISSALRMAKNNSWPEDLPAAKGRAMVVVGLDGCLESLEDDQREKWLKEHIKPLVFSFYHKFENEGALIFFFERGSTAFIEHSADAFFWRPTNKNGEALPIVKFLYGGRANEIKTLVSEVDESKRPWGIHVANPS